MAKRFIIRLWLGNFPLLLPLNLRIKVWNWMFDIPPEKRVDWKSR